MEIIFRVDDPTIAQLQSYDNGVASIFHVPTKDAREVSINYVGVLKIELENQYTFEIVGSKILN